jgi:hypothetical protein
LQIKWDLREKKIGIICRYMFRPLLAIFRWKYTIIILGSYLNYNGSVGSRFTELKKYREEVTRQQQDIKNIDKSQQEDQEERIFYYFKDPAFNIEMISKHLNN